MATTDDADELPTVPQRNPAWRTETVLAIARGIRLDDAFDRYPILADALEEAGCDDYDLLAMLRSDVDEPHVGFLEWVLEDDAGVRNILNHRLDVARKELAEAQREYNSDQRFPHWILLICLVGGLVLGFLKSMFDPPSKNPEPPKFAETDSDLRRDGRMKFVWVNGQLETRIYDKQGKQVSPPLTPPTAK